MLQKPNKTAVKQNKGLRRIIGAVLLMCSAVSFAAYCGFLGEGSYIATVQLYLLGKTAFLLPLLLFLCGYKALLDSRIAVLNKRTVLFVIFVLCLIGTAHNLFVPVGEETFPEQMKAGGGLIGGLFTLALHRTIGYDASWWLLSLGWFIIGAFAVPVQYICEKIKGLFAGKKKQAQVKDSVENIAEHLPNASVNTKDAPRKSVQFRPIEPAFKRNIYDQEEFEDFTAGIKKESPFKQILKVGQNDDNVYEKTAVKEAINREPVQIPEWEESKASVVVRPIIHYGNESKADTNTYAVQKVEEVDDDVDINRPSTAVTQGFVYSEAAEPVKAAEPRSIINNIYKQKQQEEVAAPKKVIIIDSAEKVNSASVQTTDEAQNDDSQIINDSESSNDLESVDDTNNEAAPVEPKYILPPLEILDTPKISDPVSYEADIMKQCGILEQTLADFRVRARVIAVTRGPSVTRFELEPAPGVKVSSVVNLADDIALKLAAPGVRIEAPIPGKAAIGIEVPNIKNDQVYFKEVVDNDVVRSRESKLCIGLGKDISGNIIPADLAKMPHLLVAGSTGSGKAVCINTIIAGILYKANPDEVKLILVDPKVVELSNYNGIPHLLTPVVTDAKKAASALHWAVVEMERRYQLFADNHVREINSFNKQAAEKLPFIVIIIDELADLMMVAKVDVEDAILRLAQKARAAGIHLILATQRPSVDVITGIVKANIPSRIAFAVSSQTDSRTILDMGGAEKLLGKGDMLFYPIGSNKPVRVQGAFVSDAELNRIVDFIIKQSIPVNYSEEVTAQALECDSKNKNTDDAAMGPEGEDELFSDALRLVLDMGQASSSMLQRRFRIGYTRAARLVDTMEELGIVGQSVGSKPREVIISRKEAEERFLNNE